MGGSFDDKGGSADAAGKRPTPTIEGTATEVNVAPDPETEKSDEPEAPGTKDGAPEADGLTSPDDAGETDDAGDAEQAEQPTAAEITGQRNTGGRSAAAVVLGVLTSFLTHAVAGLVGAAALLAAITWDYLPIGAPTEPQDLTPLESRIATLEQAPATPDNSAALSKLETRLGDLEGKAPETSPEVTALADRVSQLETSLNSVAEAAKDGGSVADAAAISQQINEAEKRLDTKIDSALAETKSADGASIAELKTEVAGIAAKLKALTKAELGGGDAARLGPEITDLDQRLGKIESTLPALLDAIDEENADTKSATLAIAFANLRAAVNEGRPYSAELSTLAALSPGAGDLGGLLDYEDQGIPTLRELTASFEEAREAALIATEPTSDDSVLDRLMSSAESLVKVRRVDATAEGDTRDAVLARAEAQLDAGNLAEAVKEVETLKGAPREAFAGWLDAAHARLEVDATLQKLQSILLVSLGGGASGTSEKTKKQD